MLLNVDPYSCKDSPFSQVFTSIIMFGTTAVLPNARLFKHYNTCVNVKINRGKFGFQTHVKNVFMLNLSCSNIKVERGWNARTKRVVNITHFLLDMRSSKLCLTIHEGSGLLLFRRVNI